jgi:hypothetical protein
MRRLFPRAANRLGAWRFYNGCASRVERGLEISTLAVVDLTQKGAYVLSATRAAMVQEQNNDDPFICSLATQKQIAFNELFMTEIFTKLGQDVTYWKNHPAYEEFRVFGALAA